MSKYNTSITIENNSWVGRVFDENAQEIYKTAPSHDQLKIAREIMSYFSAQQLSYTGSPEPDITRAPVTFYPVKCCGKG